MLCRQLMSRGIAVEAGLATPADAELFVRAGVAPIADGTVAADNAQLVRAAAKLLRETEAERRLQRSSA